MTGIMYQLDCPFRMMSPPQGRQAQEPDDDRGKIQAGHALRAAISVALKDVARRENPLLTKGLDGRSGGIPTHDH